VHFLPLVQLKRQEHFRSIQVSARSTDELGENNGMVKIRDKECLHFPFGPEEANIDLTRRRLVSSILSHHPQDFGRVEVREILGDVLDPHRHAPMPLQA
jgi:hypothetical protein